MPKHKIKKNEKKEVVTEDKILEVLLSINENIKDLSNKFNIPDVSKKPLERELKEEVPLKTDIKEYPIPEDYREIVDHVLNKNFGIQVIPRSDSPHFELIIVVPDKYSSISAEQKKALGADLRPKVLNYAEGLNGVREWAEKVYENLSSEIKALVVADRI